MTECADTKAKRDLAALFRGELDAEGFTRLRAHAATCPSCREAYDRLSRVESSLEKRALPGGRQALLEGELFARLGARVAPARAPAPRPERASFFRPWLGPSLGFAVAAGLAALVLVPRGAQQDDGWRARSGQAGSAWGVRAFCVGGDGQVRGEAQPGGTLACGEGDSVQFSYTAPEGARLTIEAAPPSGSGEPLRFFPSEGAAAEVAAGVDVPLPYSTPVQGGWLRGTLDVRARFVDAEGRALGETRVTLTPR